MMNPEIEPGEDPTDFDIELTETEEVEGGLYDHFRFVVDKGQTPVRIDSWLSERLPNGSRTKIQAAIDSAFVTVNTLPTKASYKVKGGDTVALSLPQPPRSGEILPEDIPLDIVYEDEHLLVLNKAAGMVVHPAVGNWTGTLVNALIFHLDKSIAKAGDGVRPGLVHRIDKDTSGLLLVAKDDAAMMRLAKQFMAHTIHRRYLALVWGVPEEAEGTIRTNLGRSLRDRRVMEVKPDSEGKHAVTHYKVLKTYTYVSLIECRLETGRTHQIRAHMRHLGHPIFSDAMYGGDTIMRGQPQGTYKAFVANAFAMCPRQALHAAELGFVHPHTGENMLFSAPIPADMQGVIDKWANKDEMRKAE